MEFTWIRKKLGADYFGTVSTICCDLEGKEGTRTEKTGFALCIPDHEHEHIDKWPDERVNALAETYRDQLEKTITEKFALPEEE